MTWFQAAEQHSSFASRPARTLLGAALAIALTSTEAAAETGKDEASASPKGTIGLALIGAESVMAVEAAFGLDRWWHYAIGGGVGAIAGGVGGYFIDRADNAQVSMSLLIGGLVLAVPTTIAVLNSTSYKPEKNPVIDDGASQAATRYHVGLVNPTPSLLGVSSVGQVHLEMPAVVVGQVFSREAQLTYNLPRATAVHVPVFRLNF